MPSSPTRLRGSRSPTTGSNATPRHERARRRSSVIRRTRAMRTGARVATVTAHGDAAAVIGREVELAALEGLLAQIRDRGAAVMLRGDPGIGKSALLQAVRRRAATQDLAVLEVVGVPSESGVPFAALRALLAPAAGGVEELAEPHRGALRAAFGLDQGAPGFFPLALAALELLSRAA